MSFDRTAISPLALKRGALRWYMSGQFFWFIGAGLQFLLIQTLATLVLDLPPSTLGFVQACFLLPSVLLILPAGVAAERNDIRLLLLRLQLGAALPSFALALLVLNGVMDASGLVVYAILAGSLNAFLMPVRDSLMSHLVPPSLVQRSVNLVTGLQFAGNMIGMSLLVLTQWVPIGAIIFLHTLVMLSTAWTSYRLPPSAAPVFLDENLIVKRRSQMMDGLRFAVRDKKIAPVVVMMAGVSFFYWGTFFTFFPLLVRDYYESGVRELAFISILFWAGMMVASWTLRRLGLVRPVGKLVAGSCFVGLLVLFLLSLPNAPLWVWVLSFVWGCAVGVFMASTRTIVQLAAPQNYVGRLLSIYQLSFMAGFPLGTLAFGLLAESASNLHHTPFAPLVGMTIVLAFVCFFSRLTFIHLDDEGKIYEQ